MKMGWSLESEGGAMRGTFGGFVALEGEKKGFITCGHLCGSELDRNEIVGKKIYTRASNHTGEGTAR